MIRIDCVAIASGRSTRVSMRASELRAVTVTGRTRWCHLPDVPTVAEEGVSDFAVISWTGLADPAGLPPAIVERLNAGLRRSLAS